MGKSNSSVNTLLCIVGEQFFYYGILDQDGNISQSDQIKINSDFTFSNSPDAINSFLKSSIQNFDFQEVKIGIANQWFNLLPNQLAEEDAVHWLAKPKDLDVDFHLDTLSQLKVGYYIPSDLKNRLLSLHHNVNFRHLMTINLNASKDQEGVHSYKLNGLQFLQVVDNQKTIYGNLVQSSSLNSQLYFSLLAFHLHHKDPHQIPFHTTASELELTEELSTYIKDMNKIKSSLSQTQASNLTNEYLFQLEKLDVCAS